MKFARLGEVGSEIPVVVAGSGIHDLRGVTPDIDGEFLASGGVSRAAAELAGGRLPVLDAAATLRIGSPIARPSAVICIGMNYAAHAAESDSLPPDAPIIFLKTPNTVVGPNDAVTIPPGSVKTDWEVELGVVIGSRASYLRSADESPRHIAGFVIANDVSERDFQLSHSGGQWSKGKCAPGFNPTGPYLVTPDGMDYQNLRMKSFVNSQPRQDSSTADMIFSIDYLIWHLSQYLALEPGDLILTGTPQGVALSGKYPYLRDGDIVEMEIEGLGRQRQQFVKA